jgi:hypothetical protein
VSTLSGYIAGDIGGLSGKTVISMPAVTKRGIPKYDYSSAKGRKIANEAFARFDAGDAEMRAALLRIAVQHALPDTVIRG